MEIVLGSFTEYLETIPLFKQFKEATALFKKLVGQINPEAYFKNWLKTMTPSQLKEVQKHLNSFTKELNKYLKVISPDKRLQVWKEKTKQKFTDELGGVPYDVWVGLSSSWVKDGMFVPTLESRMSTNVYGILYIRTQHSPTEYMFPLVNRKTWVMMVSATGENGSGAGSWLWASGLLKGAVKRSKKRAKYQIARMKKAMGKRETFLKRAANTRDFKVINQAGYKTVKEFRYAK